jgi:octaprenyl-diphosphate synthase
MVLHSSQPAPSGDLVSEISSFLGPQLPAVERTLHGIVDSESALIREVGDYISRSSGKKLRPMVCLLVARALGSPVLSPPIELAAALEAVHMATLLHDDVIDGAAMRRGQASVNSRWNDDVAILMADYLFAASFDLALKHMGMEPLRLLCEVTRRMCEGEMFQIERRGKWLTPEDYIDIISRKTAYLFSACAAIGGLHAGLEPEGVAAVTAFGMDFGLAFQITDDTLDYTAADAQWGKPVGIDLASGKQTLPLILTLQAARGAERAELESALTEGRNPDLVREAMRRHDAIARSLAAAREHIRRALASLEGLAVRDRAAFELLRALPEYVIGRSY